MQVSRAGRNDTTPGAATQDPEKQDPETQDYKAGKNRT